MHIKQIVTAGRKIEEASKALIMIHGRGASAEDILSLTDFLSVDDHAVFAPQATNHTWYPFSFLEAPANNEPWLSSALSIIAEIVSDIAININKENIFFVGFSQGACLTLEFVARNAQKFGGVAAFTGGLIGDKIYKDNYKGNFAGTSIFIGTSDPDPHVPVQRVHETVNILRNMNATVTERIYKNMGHTIVKDEIEMANKLIFSN